jgi:hypothetical protein
MACARCTRCLFVLCLERFASVRRELQIDHLERRSDGRLHLLKLTAERLGHLLRKRCSVLLSEFKRASRIRILIRPAQHKKYRRSARVVLLELRLREPGIVAADLLELACQCCIVARVTEQNGPHCSVRTGHSEHRHVMIHGSWSVDAERDPYRR